MSSKICKTMIRCECEFFDGDIPSYDCVPEVFVQGMEDLPCSSFRTRNVIGTDQLSMSTVWLT